MATKRKIQVRYGSAASRPTLATGEFGLDTDTGAESLWVGTPAGNKMVSDVGEKEYIARITQSSTNAPVETTVFKNTTGDTLSFGYSDVGVWTITPLTGSWASAPVVYVGSITASKFTRVYGTPLTTGITIGNYTFTGLVLSDAATFFLHIKIYP